VLLTLRLIDPVKNDNPEDGEIIDDFCTKLKMNPYAEVSRKAIAFLMNSFKYAVGHYFAE